MRVKFAHVTTGYHATQGFSGAFRVFLDSRCGDWIELDTVKRVATMSARCHEIPQVAQEEAMAHQADGRSGERVTAEIQPELVRAMEAFIKSFSPIKVPVTQVVEEALYEYLTKRGWFEADGRRRLK